MSCDWASRLREPACSVISTPMAKTINLRMHVLINFGAQEGDMCFIIDLLKPCQFLQWAFLNSIHNIPRKTFGEQKENVYEGNHFRFCVGACRYRTEHYGFSATRNRQRYRS